MRFDGLGVNARDASIPPTQRNIARTETTAALYFSLVGERSL